MTQPQSPPSGLTFQEAVALAAAAAITADAVAATTVAMSASVIAAREAAAAYAKALIFAAWGVVDPYSGDQVGEFTTRAARFMTTAQTATARSAAAGQGRILAAMGVRVPSGASDPTDVRAPAVDVVDGRLELRRPDSVQVRYDTRADVKVAAEDSSTTGMFNRPARTLRALEAQGASRAEADAAARDRIDRLVEDNVMLAQRFAESEVLQNAVNLDDPVIGYRRVIHPELSRTGVCGLCIAASDRLYKVGTLLPIHSLCKCTIAAVTAEHDPAAEVNAVDLERLYGLSGGTANPQLKRIRFQVDEHGELGPTLVPAKPFKPRTKFRQGRRRAPVTV